MVASVLVVIGKLRPAIERAAAHGRVGPAVRARPAAACPASFQPSTQCMLCVLVAQRLPASMEALQTEACSKIALPW